MRCVARRMPPRFKASLMCYVVARVAARSPRHDGIVIRPVAQLSGAAFLRFPLHNVHAQIEQFRRLRHG